MYPAVTFGPLASRLVRKLADRLATVENMNHSLCRSGLNLSQQIGVCICWVYPVVEEPA